MGLDLAAPRILRHGWGGWEARQVRFAPCATPSGNDRYLRKIGIGGCLAAPPLPRHRAYGSVPRRFDRVRLGRAHRFGEDRASRNSGCAAPVGPTGVLTFARGPWASRPPPPH